MSSGSACVVLVRHGETDFKRSDIYQGSSDVPALTPVGEAQAARLGRLLRGVRFDRIYCSPLRRARLTLEIVTHELKQHPSLRIRSELTEVSIPGWAGWRKTALAANFPDELAAWRNAPHQFRARDGTSPLGELYSRLTRLVHRIAMHAGTTLIVGHDHVNRALMIKLLGLEASAHIRIPQPVGGMAVLTSDGPKREFSLASTGVWPPIAGQGDISTPSIALAAIGKTRETAAHFWKVLDGIALKAVFSTASRECADFAEALVSSRRLPEVVYLDTESCRLPSHSPAASATLERSPKKTDYISLNRAWEISGLQPSGPVCVAIPSDTLARALAEQLQFRAPFGVVAEPAAVSLIQRSETHRIALQGHLSVLESSWRISHE